MLCLVVDFNSTAMIIPGFRHDFHVIITNRGIDPDLEVVMLISGEVIHQNKGWMFGPTAEARKAWFAFCRDIQRLLLTPEETALILGICLTYSGTVKHNFVSPAKHSDT